MFRKKFLATIRSCNSLTNLGINSFRSLYCGYCLRDRRLNNQTEKPSPAIGSKYQILSEENATVIGNTADEIHVDQKYPILSDEFEGINLKRGKTGVFDIKDLVTLLARENSMNIFVATVPKEINYVEYICVVSGKSRRHLLALAEFVRKVYKKKRNNDDEIPKIEGKNSGEWMALDLGNIALHIFTEKTRRIYDLETLWAVGPEYDEQVNKTSDVVEIFENYSSYLKDLKPLA